MIVPEKSCTVDTVGEFPKQRTYAVYPIEFKELTRLRLNSPTVSLLPKAYEEPGQISPKRIMAHSIAGYVMTILQSQFGKWRELGLPCLYNLSPSAIAHKIRQFGVQSFSE